MTVAIRQVAVAVLVSLVCVSVASGQDAAVARTAASLGPGTNSKTVDKSLQMPKCLRREPFEPLHRIVPSTSRLVTGRLFLLTMCSPGVDLNPIPSLGDRRSDVNGTGSGVATSFEQLEVLVGPGNAVTLTDASGSELTGRIETLSSSALSLAIDGTRRDFLETDVTMIRQRRGDSLANGAWWGFGVGAGLASLVLVAFAACDVCDGEVEPGVAAAVVGVYGAMGAGIGVGIDALIRGQQTIYRRPSAGVSFRF